MIESSLKAQQNILLAGDDEGNLYLHRYRFHKSGLGQKIEVETSPGGMLSKIQNGDAKPNLVILYASTSQEVSRYTLKLKTMTAVNRVLTSLLLIISGTNKTEIEDMAEKHHLFNKIFTRMPHVDELVDKYPLN